jgi:D-alanyl-lipoteichoic acid acyltransferase DltB (MBOAT superfamily)
MTIVSPAFALLVAVVVPVCHLLGARARVWWLLAASYVFYALAAWQFLPVLAGVTVLTWLVGTRLVGGGASRRAWLAAGILLNVAALALLRVFFREQPFGGPFVVLGVSFYSLQAISYLVDLHTGSLRRPGRLDDVALYLAYFPKLVAGPIERAGTFLAQLARPRVVDDETFTAAMTAIAVGLTRKLLIADPLGALIPPQAFTAPTGLGAGVLLAALVGYVFVLYNDFAAYTGIVRGVSALCGIELSPNFAQPFLARSFTEFWTRWHVSLSAWLRTYVYLPLSRALLRRRPGVDNLANLLLPPIVTMLAGGLWHGASAHMLLWGGLHGVYLAAEQLPVLWRPRRPMVARSRWRQLAGVAVVFVVGVATFSLFRMELPVAIAFWREVLRGAAGPQAVPWLGAYLAASLAIDVLERRGLGIVGRAPRVVRAAGLAVLILLWLAAADRRAVAPFVYQGF